MVLFVVLFWLVLIWGLYDGDVYFKDAGLFVLVWLPFAVCFFFVPQAMIVGIVGMLIVDVVLLLKVFGQNIGIT